MEKQLFLCMSLMITASVWSCGPNDGDKHISEQDFTSAAGMYHGAAAGMQADSLGLVFEAGQFSGGKPVGEAKKLTVTCYVPPIDKDELFLPDGEYNVATVRGKPPVFIQGTQNEGILSGTYLEAAAGRAALTLFTGGNMNVVYVDKSGQYSIIASLTDAEGNTFKATYIGKLDVLPPEIVYDEKPANLIAMYLGKGDSPKPQRWLLDLFSDEKATGGYTGIFLDTYTNRVFIDGANTLQEGEYRISTDATTGTYLPGHNGDGKHSGSYYYKMDKDQKLLSGIYITGGTFSIFRNPQTGKYALRAILNGVDMESRAETGKSIEYIGNPTYLDMMTEQSANRYVEIK